MNYRKWHLHIFCGVWTIMMGFFAICNGAVVAYGRRTQMQNDLILLAAAMFIIGIVYMLLGSLLINKPSHYGKYRNRIGLSIIIMALCIGEIAIQFFGYKISILGCYPAILPLILLPIAFALHHDQHEAAVTYDSNTSPQVYGSNPYTDPNKVLQDFPDPKKRQMVFEKLLNKKLITPEQYNEYIKRINE